MSNVVEVKIPDIGDFDSVEVIEVLVAEGDAIEAEQSLITVESDKASMEIPAPSAGTVKSLKIKVGDKVQEGSVILVLEGAQTQKSSDKDDAEKAPEADQEEKKQTDPASKADAAESAGKTQEPEQKASSQAGGSTSVVIPDIGDFDEVEIIEVLVSEGDSVEAEQSLITVESDKASMEIPSSASGTVKSLKVKVGDKVSKGTEILELAVSGSGGDKKSSQASAKDTRASSASSKPAEQEQEQEQEQQSQKRDEASAEDKEQAQRASPTQAYEEDSRPLRDLPHASPSVRKFARELGVNLARVNGSGRKGRIVADDVRQFVKQAVAGSGAGGSGQAAGGGLQVVDWPKVDFAKFGPVQNKPLSRIKKLSGAYLHRNWVMIPHVTNNDEADITELEALRKQLNKENEKSGVKVTMLAFLIKACVAALKKFPEFNASLDGDNLVLKQYYHIGFAADTPNGLVVPVIRDADQKGILDLARETAELAVQARDGKLSPSQMQGGTFSISSLGGIGGTDFTPIINAPEVAILGVSRSSFQPVWDGSAFQPRLMLPLSLSYDHRVIDGAAAARFNVYLGQLLADFRRIAL
ncbi:MAG: dihydrolipoyllysine-residue acetyltransferase [Pusillimonas sp.]|nr:dihydrolipoyllysine-residue acetyltransferase [Pusillimonas sp.]MBC43839.1 dihydrolipoyllysine-residue acetyltransferase [Pusillimonas sp.]HCP78093.1 dihydrolipoyllysine-residue acetyltransferase [Pusillimonas sp.]|tara:strand:+ start:28009 stop:29757 length:1749 start_codon:yes stop_codon:yes gene_type:complete